MVRYRQALVSLATKPAHDATARSRFRDSGLIIGTAGFEPATPATPLQCATGLRHVPRTEIIKTSRGVGKRSGSSNLKRVNDIA